LTCVEIFLGIRLEPAGQRWSDTGWPSVSNAFSIAWVPAGRLEIVRARAGSNGRPAGDLDDPLLAQGGFQGLEAHLGHQPARYASVTVACVTVQASKASHSAAGRHVNDNSNPRRCVAAAFWKLDRPATTDACTISFSLLI
jgi:hypothetical protein